VHTKTTPINSVVQHCYV